MSRSLKDVDPDEPGMPIQAWLNRRVAAMWEERAKWRQRLKSTPEWALTKDDRDALGMQPPQSVIKPRKPKRRAG